MVTIFERTFIYFYASLIGISQMLKLKDHRPLILPLGLVSIALSQVVHANSIHSDQYNQQTWPLVTYIFPILLPTLLIFISNIRKIKKL